MTSITPQWKARIASRSAITGMVIHGFTPCSNKVPGRAGTSSVIGAYRTFWSDSGNYNPQE